MKKTKFILGVVAAALVAMTGCELGLNNADDRASESGYDVSKIEITTKPSKTKFVINSAFSSDGLVVTATYKDNSTADVSKDVSVSTPDMTSLGAKTITVSYAKTTLGETCAAVTTTYEIEVTREVSSIALKEGSVIYSYNNGTVALVPSSAKIVVKYNDNTTEEIDASDATWSAVSEGQATATYQGKTCTVSVTDVTSATDLYNAGVSVADLYNAGAKGTELVSIANDYAVGTSDYATSWAAGKDYTLASGNTQILYFVNYGSGAANWNNFLIEFFTANSGITVRADNYGWNYGTSSGTDLDYSDTNMEHSTTVAETEWATWSNAMKAGALVKLVVEHSGNYITFTCTSNDSALSTWKQIYKATALTDVSKASISYHLNCDGSYMVVLKDKE